MPFKNAGKCCIKYNVCEAPSNTFEIGLFSGDKTSLTEEYCPKNFVLIEGGTARGSFGTITNRYCGAAFNSIPFIDQSAEVCGKFGSLNLLKIYNDISNSKSHKLETKHEIKKISLKCGLKLFRKSLTPKFDKFQYSTFKLLRNILYF